VNEYVVLAVRPVTAYELVEGDAIRVPFLYTRYPVTPTASVEEFQDSITPV
jgi:hypothetical protein